MDYSISNIAMIKDHYERNVAIDRLDDQQVRELLKSVLYVMHGGSRVNVDDIDRIDAEYRGKHLI